MSIVAPQDAQLCLIYGDLRSQEHTTDRPTLRIFRRGRGDGDSEWRQDFIRLAKAVLRRELTAENPELISPNAHDIQWDLPLIFHAVLHGWEEQGGTSDEHGRFDPNHSLLGKLGILSIPVLDIVARAFGQLLSRSITGKPSRRPSWTFCLTLDIDSAGMYQPRALPRTFLELLKRNPLAIPAALSECLRHHLGIYTDPQTRFRQLAEMFEGLSVPITWFVQTHRKAVLDSYQLSLHPKMIAQLKAIGANGYHELGLHSSYQTRDENAAFFKRQWRTLSMAIPEKLMPVHRAHFLRHPRKLNYPIPPGQKSLVDSSVAYGKAPGFRRGTAWPFLIREHILEQPPIVMDSTWIYHLKRSPAESFEEMLSYMESVRATGGAFVVIAHPHHLEEKLNPGWLNLLVDLVAEGKRRGARFQSLAHASQMLYAPAVTMKHDLDRLNKP